MSDVPEENVSGNLLHYEVMGKEGNPWLVFIHGAGGSVRTWKFQVAAFSPYFRLLFLDLRDHGYSKNIQPAYDSYDFQIIADDILKVIDHLEIEKEKYICKAILADKYLLKI
jgi:pimeloyl-ACP methyl ester carboxylesterase